MGALKGDALIRAIPVSLALPYDYGLRLPYRVKVFARRRERSLRTDGPGKHARLFMHRAEAVSKSQP